MTPGVTTETVDGMTLAKIDTIIEALRHERHRWTPVRRVNIPKPQGGTRSLGIPTWTDKLVQEVIRLILEAYYEPQFSAQSHGFRPNRGCHTALMEIKRAWTGTKWFIEGDIRGCFDNINHEKLIAILAEQIHDNRFLRIIRQLLQAGYLEQWRHHRTHSGTPQGSVVSPILANIYMDTLDKFAIDIREQFNKGTQRKGNPVYQSLAKKATYYRRTGRPEVAKAYAKMQRQTPRGDPYDPEYRRMHYVRYADDFLVGITGTLDDAKRVKAQISTFLSDTLNLEMSAEKTLITHATTESATFLGYEVTVTNRSDYHHPTQHHRRSRIGRVVFKVPAEIIAKNIAKYRTGTIPKRRAVLLQESDYTIVSRYQAEWRGIVQYYTLAYNRSALWKLHWWMRGSLLATLANKHKSTKMTMLRKYRTLVQTPYGQRVCLEVKVLREGKAPLIARFGGISLQYEPQAAIVDQKTEIWSNHTDIVQRLLANTCELCGAVERVEVHHIRKMADLHQPGRKVKPKWVIRMAARRRKTLAVCYSCHQQIHHGHARNGKT